MVESDPSDSSDENYRDIPQMPARRHDHEASSSSSAPPAPALVDEAQVETHFGPVKHSANLDAR